MRPELLTALRPRADPTGVPRLRPCAALLMALALIPAAPASARDWPAISELTSDFSAEASAISAAPDDSLWVSEPGNPGRIAQIAPDGTVTEYTAGTAQAPGFSKDKGPTGMVAGPDGRMWFLQKGMDAVARIAAGGAVDEFTGLQVKGVEDLAVGADGAIWIAERGGTGAIARMTADGTVTNEYPLTADPEAITAGPDGALWFTQPGNPGAIGRISAAGFVQRFTTGLTRPPADITAGPDGALWFTQPDGGIGRITPGGQISEFTAGINPTRSPRTIAAGPDGALWFTEGGVTPAIARITVDGVVDEYHRGLARAVDPIFIAPGTDGGMVFTSGGTATIGHITVPPAVGATTATATAHDRATFSATVRPNGQLTTYRFEFRGPTGPLRHTLDVGAGNGLDPVTVAATVEDLDPATTYTVRVVATNDSGTGDGAQTSFTTPTAPSTPSPPAGTGTPATPGKKPDPTPQPPGDTTPTQNGNGKAVGKSDPAVPTIGRSVVAKAAKGDVAVKVPGKDDFVSLDSLSTLPVGSVVDATKGEIRLRSALDAAGHSQTATFHGGRFKVAQSRSGAGMTDLLLRGGSFADCAPKARSAGLAVISRVVATASRKKKKRTVRRLWGKDSGGRFRTHGRDSIATVRGTEWLTEDRCDGTRTKVRSGVVQVRDRVTGRKVLVRAGHSHLAPHVR